MSHTDLRPLNPGEVIQKYNLSLTTTTNTATVVTGDVTFDRAFASAPSILSVRIPGTTYGRLAIIGADTPTTTGVTGFINPNGQNLTAQTVVVEIVVAGQLA